METKAKAKAALHDVDFSNAPSLYVNWSQILLGPWDARMLLGEFVPSSSETAAILPRVSVTMALPHLKAFVEAATAAIERHEKDHGKIPVSPAEKDAKK